jgi:glutamate-1-semialdehyde 2,1-aminomutase
MRSSINGLVPEPVRVAELSNREQGRFWRERPRSVELRRQGLKSMPNGVPMSWFVSVYHQDPLYISYGEGAHIVDVDGHRYLDANVGDMSTFCGYAPPAVTEAIAARATRGVQFMLPVEDSLWVAEEMGRRFGLPRWQFTLSATTANIEAIRLARFATGRGVIVMFEGHYHGHDEEWLFEREKGEIRAEYHGVDRARQSNLRLIPFNDPDALGEALEPGDVACVVTEPVLTNLGVIQPEPDFHDQLRRQTREAGILLLLDETHTAICGPGGLTAAWSLEPDLVTLGKFIGGGVPIGAYGMSAELSDVFESPDPHEPYRDIASGGTLFANALSMTAARATLSKVMTREAYAHAAQLGALLADGIECISRGPGSPGARTGCMLARDTPMRRGCRVTRPSTTNTTMLRWTSSSASTLPTEACGRRSSARGLRPRWPPPARTWIITWPCWKSSSASWRRETIARTRVT